MTTDDFDSQPWLYPGTPVDRSDPVDPAELDVGSGPGRRTLVLAVGSNASRDVLCRKFERYAVESAVSFVRARVSGLRAGHSAHVSTPGYIPAAPVVDPDVTSELVAALFDADGLAVLDATEPNYVRSKFSADRFPLEVDLCDRVVRPPAFEVYVSRHGVLAAPGEAPLGLSGQEELFDRLGSRCPGFAELATGRPRQRMRTFAGSAELRDAARDVFRDTGWATRQ